jgi:hypothetical protein
MNQYVIVGAGNSSLSVIEDSLSDLPTPRTFHVLARKTKDTGVCRVYDWLLDNKERYLAYHDGNAPAILCKNAVSTICDSNAGLAMMNAAKLEKMTVLYLWDENNGDNSTAEVTSLIDDGFTVIDLTQGLTPFRLVDTVENNTVDSLSPVTRKEYEEMSDTELRQQAKAQGATDKDFASKETIIDFLTESSKEKKVSEDDAVVVVVVFKDQTTKTFKSTVHDINSFFN